MPKRGSPTTMDKEMVHQFLLLEAHGVPTRPVKISFFKLILCEDLLFSSYLSREAYFHRCLRLPNGISGKMRTIPTIIKPLTNLLLEKELLES